MFNKLFLLVFAMWLCLSATTLSSQTTPELREIFTDPILTRLVLEEVGFYESPVQNEKKAWRVAVQFPEGLERGLWRKDSIAVAADVNWVNDSTSFFGWVEDTTLLFTVQAYQPIPAPDLPVTAPDLISGGLTWHQMDSMERIIFRLLAEMELVKIKKNMVFYQTHIGSYVEKGIGSVAEKGNWYYATKKTSKDGKKDYYHFYNQDEEWLQGFFVDSKNMRVWHTGPRKGPKFKKIFSDKN